MNTQQTMTGCRSTAASDRDQGTRRTRRPPRAGLPGSAALVLPLPLCLSLFLLGAPLAAANPAAGGGDPSASRPDLARFSLGVEAVLPPLVVAPERLATALPADGRPIGRRQLRLRDLRDPSALARDDRQQETPAADAEPARRRGLGRWLKKHWWVPALGAAALGFALADEGGDDDRLGEDD